MCTVLPLLKRPNGSSIPTSPTTTTTLPPLSRLFLVYHRLCLSIWLWIPGSFSHLMFASLFFSFPFCHTFDKQASFNCHFWEWVKNNNWKRASIICWRTWWGFLECERSWNLSHRIIPLFRQWFQSLKCFFFLFLPPGIDHFNYGRADHNTGLNVWCFTF